DERSHICGRALPSNTHHCHSRPEIGTVVPPHRSHSKACLFPTRLRCSARDLMCQLCPRFKLSTMCPVCTECVAQAPSAVRIKSANCSPLGPPPVTPVPPCFKGVGFALGVGNFAVEETKTAAFGSSGLLLVYLSNG